MQLVTLKAPTKIRPGFNEDEFAAGNTSLQPARLLLVCCKFEHVGHLLYPLNLIVQDMSTAMCSIVESSCQSLEMLRLTLKQRARLKELFLDAL
mmetsp:Transcript_32918/g.51345  ORF Transcript_32918/g.51345 Transcript_32918/m.51345 type:complete len:94 (-) Transcript_32918:1407-1688(-)